MAVVGYIARSAWREANMLARTIYGMFVVIPAALPAIAERLNWPWLSRIAGLLPWWGWLWTAATIGIAGLLIAIAKHAYKIDKAAEPILDLFLNADTIHVVHGYLSVFDNEGNRIGIEGTLIRITVINRSAIKTINNVRCVIQEIEGYVHAFTNQELEPLAAPKPFSLAAGGKQVIGALFVPDDKELNEINILYDAQLEIGRGLPRQNHRLWIQAQGLDIAPTDKRLILELEPEIKAYLEDIDGAR